MKKLKLIVLILTPLVLFAQEDGFTVTATFKGLGSNKVKVYSQVNGKVKLDTLESVGKDRVIWKGRFDEPQLVRMEVMDTTLALRIGRAVSLQPPLMFLLDNAKVRINGDAKEAFSARIDTKNSEMILYEVYRKIDIANTRESWNLQKELNRKTLANDTVGNGELTTLINQLRKKSQQNRMKYIDENSTSFASVIMLTNLFLVMPVSDLVRRYESLNSSLKKSETGKSLYSKIESKRSTSIGMPMVEIEQPGLDGNMVNSKELRGKYILLDFWGSWCVPCRKSHPALKDLYARYKPKGLEIIGISNESFSLNLTKAQQEEVWKNAIKEDGINWLHVLYDPKVSDLVKAYDINGYPTKFLIDQSGKIMLTMLGTSEANHLALEKKLAEIMPD